MLSIVPVASGCGNPNGRAGEQGCHASTLPLAGWRRGQGRTGRGRAGQGSLLLLLLHVINDDAKRVGHNPLLCAYHNQMLPLLPYPSTRSAPLRLLLLLLHLALPLALCPLCQLRLPPQALAQQKQQQIGQLSVALPRKGTENELARLPNTLWACLYLCSEYSSIISFIYKLFTGYLERKQPF